ncbi:sensor histidine kinase [Synechococcus sp. PCC 7335]|uniref:sensor histidine kinase n=1 Tax=Synechococcus sp. (strain ATCC 29403 / PCC 7335) TaxID=91464 RepID=UPI0005703A87|nr:sensor histidine kinase [Synechococcus sp. PCC 7335]
MRAIRFQNHPFRFLLYLEWGLLAMAMASVLESPPGRLAKRLGNESWRSGRSPSDAGLTSFIWHYSPVLALVSLMIFGAMGLYLPSGRLAKLGHTLGQILLVLVASVTVFNDGRTFPFIYLVLVIRGCLMFAPTGRIMLAGIAFILFLGGLVFRLRLLFGLGGRLPPQARDRFRMLAMGLQLNFIVLFALSLLLVVLLINALLTERQSQHRLQQANQTLRHSAQEIEKLAMDQERSRIARDIHDSLGHSLTALNIQLESAVKLWEKDPQRSHQFLQNAKRLGSQSLQEVRQSVATLRQDPLMGQSLETAIVHLIEDIQSSPSNHLDIEHHIKLATALPSNLQVLLYRIVQAGLTNIVKHANAKHARLQLLSSQAIATLSLEDDGEGFDPLGAKAGFGLQSMRDRAESVGGTFVLNSSRQGTSIQVSLPIGRLIAS